MSILCLALSSMAQTQSHTVGKKSYEVSNHLCNVMAVASDRKTPLPEATNTSIAFNETEIISYNDYYPYGMLLDNRNGSSNYRYGFQGQEKDDEVNGENKNINYKYRVHDPRLGRFFAVDPLSVKYPNNSTYAFSENNVIHAIELEGLEKHVLNNDETVYGPYSNETIDGFDKIFEKMLSPLDPKLTKDYYDFNNYLEGESLVGSYLNSFINSLPKRNTRATTSFQTYSLSTKQISPGGYCYVASMSRSNRAFNSLYGLNSLPLSTESDKNKDSYKYSSSRGKGLNKDYVGYGVGGALASLGLGQVVNDEDFWSGGLKLGAQIQYWWKSKEDGIQSFEDVQNRLLKNKETYGHSVIFMGYGMDDKGLYIKYSDYYGINGDKIFRPTDSNEIIFKGVNLIDH